MVVVEEGLEGLEQDRDQAESGQVVLDQVVSVLEDMELGLEELVQVVLDQLVSVLEDMELGLEELVQVVLDQVVSVLEDLELGLEELVQVVLDQDALVQVAKAQAWSFVFFGW